MWNNTHWRNSQNTDKKTEAGQGKYEGHRREANIQVNDIPE